MTAIEMSSEIEPPKITPEEAAGVIGNSLTAADDTERAELVEGLNNALGEAGVVVVDIAPDQSSRKGRLTKLTHDQLLDALETTRHAKAIRAARAIATRRTVHYKSE